MGKLLGLYVDDMGEDKGKILRRYREDKRKIRRTYL